jgi:hypothetical protein
MIKRQLSIAFVPRFPTIAGGAAIFLNCCRPLIWSGRFWLVISVKGSIAPGEKSFHSKIFGELL